MLWVESFPGFNVRQSKARRVSVAQDPPKKGVAEAVVDAQKAGVKARNRRIEGINTLVVGNVLRGGPQADRCK